LRPVLNKNKEGVGLEILLRVANLVKFISGEHGDGIVRGEFYLYDWRENYELLKRIKLAFDSVLNMGKIVNALKWMKISVLNW
jgi:FAD/FMN-containing dehydrogenase